MYTHKPAFPLALLAIGLASGSAASQTPPGGHVPKTIVAQKRLFAAPVDVAITPDAEFTVIRGIDGTVGASNEKLSVWTTLTAARVFPTGSPAGGATVGRGNLQYWLPAAGVAPTTPYFSDAVAVTNDRAIAIGSFDAVPDPFSAEDTTYVDILALNGGSTPSAAVLATLSYTGSNAWDRAGGANDVAITPDGTTAVVSHNNYIHVFDLATGTQKKELHVGSPAAIPADGIGGNGTCWPGQARDSVELTDTRAVVTMERFEFSAGAQQARTWVYVVDLTLPSPVVLLEDKLEPVGMGEQWVSPHDLMITPNGARAVVAANAVVGLYDIASATPSRLGALEDNRARFRPIIGPAVGEVTAPVDSVECTDSRAVVIGNRNDSVSYFWTARVYDISGSTLTPIGPEYQDPAPAAADWAFDLAISAETGRAAVKSFQKNILLLDLNAPSATSFVIDASAPITFADFFQSDAVEIAAPSGSSQVATFLGQEGGSGTTATRVAFYDIASASPTQSPMVFSSGPGQTRPADLHLGDDVPEVIVRAFSGTTLAPAIHWHRYAFGTPPVVELGSGASAVGGHIAVDAVEVARTTSVSISTDNTTPAVGGFVHFVRTL